MIGMSTTELKEEYPESQAYERAMIWLSRAATEVADQDAMDEESLPQGIDDPNHYVGVVYVSAGPIGPEIRINTREGMFAFAFSREI